MAERRVVIVLTGEDEVLDLAKDLLLGEVGQMVTYSKDGIQYMEVHRMFQKYPELDNVKMEEGFDGS